MKKLLNYLLTLTLIFTVFFSNFSIADVGDFEDYDSDWGSSDWDYDYDSDWESSDWDYGTGTYVPLIFSGGSPTFITVVIYIIIIYLCYKYSRRGISNANRTRRVYNNPNSNYVRSNVRSEAVANKVREVDEFFNDEKFLTEVKNSFVKLQTAWSERNWESIRPLESEALFEQHSRQLKGYIDRKQINKLERICVNYAELVSYDYDNEKEILVVALNSSMNDYIIDETSGKVLKGDKDRRITNTYKLTYVRKKGVKTEEGTDEIKTTNCPNCGAPTRITSSGKCEYCGSVITTGQHDWVLNDMERF